MREYRRMGKHADYIAAKKRIVESLSHDHWGPLSALILREGNEFVSERVEADSTGFVLEMQLEQLATSNEIAASRAEKFKLVHEPRKYVCVGSCSTLWSGHPRRLRHSST